MEKEISKLIQQDDDITNSDEGLIFNPFNPENREIKLSEVQSILRSYGLPPIVHNLNLYKRAFCHTSYTKRPFLENQENNITVVDKPSNCIPLKTKSNERLEFLGDGVLEAVTKYYLYKRFPKANEGFMTEKKIALVKNEAIGKLAYDMKLNKWLLISKHAEEKKIRTNLKKLGCLFEAFLGALFLDMNKIEVSDEEKWFETIFTTGPGFQMAQKFIETIFERHIDWTRLVNYDDNFKNIFQVKIQKEFKITPDYLEIEHNLETGYLMGVYICLGKSIHEVNHKDSVPFEKFGCFSKIQDYLLENEYVLVFMGWGLHKIKKKAEQIACDIAINKL